MHHQPVVLSKTKNVNVNIKIKRWNHSQIKNESILTFTFWFELTILTIFRNFVSILNFRNSLKMLRISAMHFSASYLSAHMCVWRWVLWWEWEVKREREREWEVNLVEEVDNKLILMLHKAIEKSFFFIDNVAERKSIERKRNQIVTSRMLKKRRYVRKFFTFASIA